jgi:hypothetical protein
MREPKVGHWLPLLLAVTTAVDGWLVLGPLAQSTLMAAAVLRKLKGTMSAAAGRTSEVE